MAMITYVVGYCGWMRIYLLPIVVLNFILIRICFIIKFCHFLLCHAVGRETKIPAPYLVGMIVIGVVMFACVGLLCIFLCKSFKLIFDMDTLYAYALYIILCKLLQNPIQFPAYITK